MDTGTIETQPSGSVEEKSEEKTTLKTPYCIAFMEKAQKEIPENAEAMKTILQEIDRQAIENFELFTPENYPGTELSFTKLTITPDLIKKIAKLKDIKSNEETSEGDKIENKDELAFLFTAMGKPPDGNAYTALDMGIDRFIRYLPKIASAIKNGENIPNIEIYLMGAGTGYGEKASPDFVKDIQKRGLDVRGEVYSEFVQKMLEGKKLEDTKVLLQGVSMGTTTADKTFSHLPDRIKKISQRLFDNPAGTHNSSIFNKWRGFQAAIGLGAEFAVRELFDPVAKTLGKAKAPFVSYLFEKKGLKADTPYEKKNKDALFKAAGLKLFGGAELNLDNARSYIRQGIKDPLTTTPARIGRTMMRRGKKIETHSGQQDEIKVPFRTKSRALEVTTGKSHFFMYENFDRFNQIINYCKAVPSS